MGRMQQERGVKKARLRAPAGWEPAAGRGPAPLLGRNRKRVGVDEKVPLELNARERELILKHTFADSNLTDRLRLVPGAGRPFYRRS